MEWLRLTSGSVMVMPAVLLALCVTSLLLTHQPKTFSFWMLIAFVVSSTVFVVAVCVEFMDTSQLEPYTVITQYLSLLIGFVCLIQYAYQPLASLQNIYRREHRIVTGISICNVFVGIGLSSYYFIHWQPHRSTPLITQIIAFLLLTEYCWAMLVFVRQTWRCAAEQGVGRLKAFISPPDQASRIARNFTAILCSPILVAILTILRDAEMLQSTEFHLLLSLCFLGFFVVLLLGLSNAGLLRLGRQQKNTFAVLILLYTVLTCVTYLSAFRYEQNYEVLIKQAVEQARQIIVKNETGQLDQSLFPQEIVYILTLEPAVGIVMSRDPQLPVDAIVDESRAIRELDMDNRILALRQFNPALDPIQARMIVRREMQLDPVFFRRVMLFAGSIQRQYYIHAFIIRNTFYELGFRYSAYRDYLHNSFAPYAYVLLISTVIGFLFIYFPQRTLSSNPT